MQPDIKSEGIHMSARYSLLSAVGLLALSFQCYAITGGYVKNIEVHETCFEKKPACTMQLDAVHRGEYERFIYVNPKAKFIFEENTAWYPCTNASLNGICLKFGEKDLIRWNLFNSRKHGIERTALVLNGKVLSVLAGHGGVAKNPLLIGQVDGSPPTELSDFLARATGP